MSFTAAAGPDLGEEADEQVDRLLDDRLRLAAHEIRQPVAVVLAIAEAARWLPGVTDEVAAYLERIIDQVQELSAAAGSVLDVYGDCDVGPVDLDEVLRSVTDAISFTWRGTVERLDDGGELLVGGDRARVRRCLVNVVDNAVRAAGPRGRILITARRADDTIRVDVEDDGPGFGHLPTRTGLGLATTRQAIEAIGGGLAIGLPSRSGGARVALTFPIRAGGRNHVAPPGYAV